MIGNLPAINLISVIILIALAAAISFCVGFVFSTAYDEDEDEPPHG